MIAAQLARSVACTSKQSHLVANTAKRTFSTGSVGVSCSTVVHLLMSHIADCSIAALLYLLVLLTGHQCKSLLSIHRPHPEGGTWTHPQTELGPHDLTSMRLSSFKHSYARDILYKPTSAHSCSLLSRYVHLFPYPLPLDIMQALTDNRMPPILITQSARRGGVTLTHFARHSREKRGKSLNHLNTTTSTSSALRSIQSKGLSH